VIKTYLFSIKAGYCLLDIAPGSIILIFFKGALFHNRTLIASIFLRNGEYAEKFRFIRIVTLGACSRANLTLRQIVVVGRDTLPYEIIISSVRDIYITDNLVSERP